jgi:hypothetical protein
MRYRLMATYRGVHYEAGIGPSGSDVVLFAACPPPEELGFEPATGHWRKPLPAQEVQALWESRPQGTFRGEPCMVLDDLGDRLHIAYLGHDAYQAQRLGYWQVDRGVFELVAPRSDVSNVVEERADYPLAPTPPDPGPRTAFRDAPLSRPIDAAMPPDLTAMPPDLTAMPPDLAVVPPTAMPRLPLEAEALEATQRMSALRQRSEQQAAAARQPLEPRPLDSQPLDSQPLGAQPLSAQPLSARPLDSQPPELGRPLEPTRSQPQAPARRRRPADGRAAAQRTFDELASQAAIPPSAYSLGEEVDGTMCLIQTDEGFEVFNAVAGARHEMRFFEDEESAYFYLFGVLAAEAVRTGRLATFGAQDVGEESSALLDDLDDRFV